MAKVVVRKEGLFDVLWTTRGPFFTTTDKIQMFGFRVGWKIKQSR